MAVKLILTDIDGTVLPRGQRQVSARTAAAFHAAVDAGIVVGPASGRGYSWIPDFFGGDQACCSTALATNGMQVYLHGEKVMEQTLAPGALEHLRAIVAETPRAGLVCFDDATPLLVEGSLEDLAAHFPAYAERCRVTRELPDFAVVKANVFTGAGEPAALIGAADHERLAAALAGGDGGGEAGGACADDGDVVHADPSREFFAHGRVFAPRLCYDRDIPPQCSRRTRCAQGGREENAGLPR